MYFTLIMFALLSAVSAAPSHSFAFESTSGSLVHEYNHHQQLQFRQHPSAIPLQQLTASVLISSAADNSQLANNNNNNSTESSAELLANESNFTMFDNSLPIADLAPSALLASLASRASARPSSSLGSHDSSTSSASFNNHHLSNSLLFNQTLSSAPAGGCPEGPFPHRDLDVASKAFLAPVVFTGQLVSLADDYAGRIAATFRVLKTLKNQQTASQSFPGAPLPDSAGHVVLYFVRKPGHWFQPPHCAVYLNATAYAQLRLQARYILFAAAPLPDLLRLHQIPIPTAATNQSANEPNNNLPPFSLHYLSAFAPPEPLNKRTYKSVYRVTCKRCLSKSAQVEGIQGDLRVQVKSKLRLKCKMSGNPQPWIEWYRNGKKLRSRGRITIKNSRKMSRLEISRVESSDSGYYECRAMNVASRQPAAAKTRLIVTLPPKRNANKSSQHLLPLSSHKFQANPQSQSSSSSTTAANLWPLMGRSCPVEDYCLNGGSCIFFENVIEYVCQCAPGYRGTRCHEKDVSLIIVPNAIKDDRL